MKRVGSVGEVFLAFLRLGLTSFGGPVAHLGYFRDAIGGADVADDQNLTAVTLRLVDELLATPLA